MGWIQKLHETYNNCQSMIGAETNGNEIPLLPICHTTQKAQIEIALDGQGNFKRARVIPKKESRTIIPCTEKSAGRTSGEAAHPLCDKLQYVATDYKEHGGDKDPYYESYAELLADWVNHSKNKKVRLVQEYTKRGTIVADLIAHNVLVVGKNNKLLKQRANDKTKAEGLDIFDLLPGRVNKKGEIENWQADAFVRWKLEIPNDPQSAVWSDPEIIQSWIAYYSTTKQTKALCYVTGKETFSADQHPAKLRNDGDKAKIISSNDTSGYTFRGRFLAADQAATVGFETTQKAHFALRWLISRQGFRKGDLAIVAWATSGAPIPKPTDDPLSILGFADLPTDGKSTVSTAQEVAVKLRKRIAGYGREIGDTTDVVVMGLDSATPGRLAIIYYRELTGSDFLQRIDNWHESCAWLHHYRPVEFQGEDGKPMKRYIPFMGAPAPSDIAEAAYATNNKDKFQLDEKLRKATIARLLPCIIDGQPIPRDLVESAVRRASNREGLSEYAWNKTLSIACALFRKFKQGKEKYEMSLDETRTTRDYLYGRLLAVADILEERALYKAKEKRATNAARYMQQFSQHPFRTWNQIHSALTPYIVRLGGAFYYKNQIAEVKGLFDPDDFISDRSLTGEYLLGYYCQRQKLMERSKPSSDEDEDDDEGSDA